jgi:hypothetical protein
VQERVNTTMMTLTANKGVAAGRLQKASERMRSRGKPEVQYTIQAREKK